MNNLLTITAIDRDSSDTMSRTFSTESPELFMEAVEKFESELSYRKYELITNDMIEDYSEEIINILDELLITN